MFYFYVFFSIASSVVELENKENKINKITTNILNIHNRGISNKIQFKEKPLCSNNEIIFPLPPLKLPNPPEILFYLM